MKILATVRDYDSLHKALRARKNELEISMITLDEAAGFTPGHAAKLLAPRPLKKLGAVTLGLMLGALGVQLIMVEDVEALKRITSKLVKSRFPQAMLAAKSGRGKHLLFSKRFLRKIAGRGGDMRARKLGARKRQRIARKAAKARWHKPTLVEVTTAAAPSSRARS